MELNSSVRIVFQKTGTDNPYLRESCLWLLSNSSRAVLKAGSRCNKYPGPMLSFPIMAIKALGLEPIIIRTDGGFTPNGMNTSIPDLLIHGKADVSVANFWYTNFKLIQPGSVLYTDPIAIEPPICFAVCSWDLLYRPQPMSNILESLLPFVSQFILPCFFLSFLFWTLHRSLHKTLHPESDISAGPDCKSEGVSISQSEQLTASGNGYKLNLSGIQKLMNTANFALSSFGRVQCRHWKISYSLIWLSIVFWRDSFINGKLMAVFVLVRNFPFANLPDLTQSLARGDIELGFNFPFFSSFTEVNNSDAFEDLRSILRTRPPVFLGLEGLPKHLISLEASKSKKFLVYRGAPVLIGDTLRAFDCECSDLGTSSSVFSGIIIRKDRPDLVNKFDHIFRRLRESGITSRILDRSQVFENEAGGISLNRVPASGLFKKLELSHIAMPLRGLQIAYLFALFVFFGEIMSERCGHVWN